MDQCPRCQQGIAPGGGYCPRCGAALGPPPPPPGAGPGITAQEWQAFLGPNAEAYLRKFGRFGPPGREVFVATWHWPAGLAVFWWFLYRKLYLWFGLCLVGLCVPYLRWLVWIAAGLCANYIYFIEAQKQIRALKLSSPAGQLHPRLAQAGGVHPWVPWVAIVVSVCFCLLLMFMLLFLGGLTMGWFMGLAAGR